MESTEPLPFNWDMSMYNAHFTASHGDLSEDENPNLTPLGDEGLASEDSEAEHIGALGHDEVPEKHALNFEDAHEPAIDLPTLPLDAAGFAPTTLEANHTHLVRMGGQAWGIARYAWL